MLDVKELSPILKKVEGTMGASAWALMTTRYEIRETKTEMQRSALKMMWLLRKLSFLKSRGMMR